MKRLMLLLWIGAGVPVAAFAGANDSKLSMLWQDVSSRDSFHFMDNATPSYFYDFHQKENLMGATTALYKKHHVSADFGVAGSMETSHKAAFPLLGVNLHAGELCTNNVNACAGIANALGFNNEHNLLSHMTAGGWIARDFNLSIWRYGVFSGIKFAW